MQVRDVKLNQIIDWADKIDDVRAVLITSSLVNPLAPVDDLSDLDIEIIFENNEAYVRNSNWVHLFGKPIAMIEEDESQFDGLHAMKMVLYEDQVKVDFKLFSKNSFLKEAAKDDLHEDWDIGYKVLIDKENLTKNLKEPGYQVSIIKKPSQEQFAGLIKNFWWDTTYVAKCLVRDEIFYAKFMSENIIRTDYLVPLTEWYIASDNNWNITTNKHGRLFKKYLPEEMWRKIILTFSGSAINENWNALFHTADLVSELGFELAQKLHYAYPHEVEKNIRKYLLELKPD